LMKGYHQVPVAAVDIPKTAIIMPFGLYEYLYMPFGLRNSPRRSNVSCTTCFAAWTSASLTWTTTW
jgi:hypothetical protein